MSLGGPGVRGNQGTGDCSSYKEQPARQRSQCGRLAPSYKEPLAPYAFQTEAAPALAMGVRASRSSDSSWSISLVPSSESSSVAKGG